MTRKDCGRCFGTYYRTCEALSSGEIGSQVGGPEVEVVATNFSGGGRTCVDAETLGFWKFDEEVASTLDVLGRPGEANCCSTAGATWT